MSQDANDTILVWSIGQRDDEKSALPKIARKATEATQVSAEILSDNLKEFIQKFKGVIDPDTEVDGFFVDELELSLVVNAKGGVELLGKVEAGAQASLKIKLKRRTKN